MKVIDIISKLILSSKAKQKLSKENNNYLLSVLALAALPSKIFADNKTTPEKVEIKGYLIDVAKLAKQAGIEVSDIEELVIALSDPSYGQLIYLGNGIYQFIPSSGILEIALVISNADASQSNVVSVILDETLPLDGGTIDYSDFDVSDFQGSLISNASVTIDVDLVAMGAAGVVAFAVATKSSTTTTTTETLEGVISEGLLKNAQVFLDLDGDNTLDWTDANTDGLWDAGEGEQWTLSAADGSYTLSGLSAADIAAGTLMGQAYKIGGVSQTVDMISGSDVENIIMMADTSATVITPLTSMVKSGISNADALDILGLDGTAIDINSFNPFSDDNDGTANAIAYEKVATKLFTTVNSIAEAIDSSAGDDLSSIDGFILAMSSVATKMGDEIAVRTVNTALQAEADALEAEAAALQAIVDAAGVDVTAEQTAAVTAKQAEVTAKEAEKTAEQDLDLTDATTIAAVVNATIIAADTQIKAIKAAEEAVLQAESDALEAEAVALQAIVDAAGVDVTAEQTAAVTAKEAQVTAKDLLVTAKNTEATTDKVGDSVTALVTNVSKAIVNVNTEIESITAFDVATAKNTLNMGAETLVTQVKAAVDSGTTISLAADTLETLSEDDTSISFTAVAGTATSLTGFYGDISNDSGSTWTYTLDSDGQAQSDGDSYQDTFTITDSNNDAHSVTVTVFGKDDAAVISAADATIAEGVADVSGSSSHTDVDTDDADDEFLAVTDVASTYGTYTVTTAGDWTYTLGNANTTIDALGDDESTTDTVTVTSGDGTTKDITIIITGVNDAPVFTSAATASAPENGTAAAIITATDVESDAITYSISGTDEALFSIVASTGVLTFKTAPDYELTDPVADDNTYSLTVTASDGTVTVDQALTVTVTNVEGGPVFSSAEAITVDENQTAVVTLTASDDENDNIAFTISGGDDQDSFDLSSGVLTFKAAPNYEVKSSYSATVTATESSDKDGGAIASPNSTTQDITVTITDINDAPTVSTAISDASTNEDAAYSYDASTNFSDVDSGDGATYSVSGNPAWLSITSAGVLSGTPTNDDVTTTGTDITVTRTDTANTSVSDTFTLTVANTNDAPTISGDTTGAATADVRSVSGDLPGADIDTGDTLTYSVATELGTYGSLSVDSSGTWTYDLASSDADTVALLASDSVATDTFSVIVTDEAGGTASETVTITVGNRAPVLVNNTITLNEGDTLAITSTHFSATDADGDDVTFTVSSVTGGQFALSTAPSTAITSFSAAAIAANTIVFVDDGSEAAPSFSTKAGDGTSDSAVAAATINYTGVNDAPTTGDKTLTFNEDTVYTFSASDFTFADDDTGDAITAIQITDFTNPGGQFGLYLDANDSDDYDSGEELVAAQTVTIADINAGNLQAGAATENDNGDGFATVSFTVSDGTASSAVSGTNTFNITPVDDAATIGGDISGSGNEDNDITGTLTATDTVDGLTDSTYFTITTNSTNGSATIDAATGAWSYTPTANYNGSDSFIVTITDDDGHTETQAISLTINSISDTPVAVADTKTILEDAAATVISVLDNDTDADDGDTLSLLTKTNGSYGLVTNNGDGTVSYAPNANFNGSDTFQYSITDGTLTSEMATVTVTVSAVNDDPTGSVTITGDAKTGQTLTASNDLADIDVLGAISYQWSDDGTAVNGATNATLVLDDDDIGSAFTVTASYTDGDGTAESETSSATSAVTDIDKPFMFTSEIIEASAITTSSIGDYADTPTENIIKLTLNVDMDRISDNSVDSIVQGSLDFVIDWDKIEVISYAEGAYSKMYVEETSAVTATKFNGDSAAITTYGGLTYDGSANANKFNELLISSVDVDTTDVPNLILVDNVDTTPADAFTAGVDHASSNNLWTFYLNPIDTIDSLDITFGGSVGINQGGDDDITQLSYTVDIL